MAWRRWASVVAMLCVSSSACGDDTVGTGKAGDACATDDDCASALECDVHTGDEKGTCKPAHEDAGVPPGAQAVTIRFAPRVGDVAAACGQSLSLAGADGGDTRLRDLRFFVHDVRLVAVDGSEVIVALDQDGVWQARNVALLDFEDKSADCKYGTEAMHQAVTGIVPSGAYSGLRFKVGVPPELNHIDPTTAPPPLDTTSLSWGWGEGYMFLQMGTMTTPASGEKDNAYIIALASLGCEGDPRQGEVASCSRPNRPDVDLIDFDPAVDIVVMDLLALFDGAALSTEKGCASTVNSEPCVPIFARFGLDYTTGLPDAASQVVFAAGAP